VKNPNHPIAPTVEAVDRSVEQYKAHMRLIKVEQRRMERALAKLPRLLAEQERTRLAMDAALATSNANTDRSRDYEMRKSIDKAIAAHNRAVAACNSASSDQSFASNRLMSLEQDRLKIAEMALLDARMAYARAVTEISIIA
jgi:hypothetical protein